MCMIGRGRVWVLDSGIYTRVDLGGVHSMVLSALHVRDVNKKSHWSSYGLLDRHTGHVLHLAVSHRGTS